MPVPDIFASFADPVPVTSSAPLCAVLIDAEEDFDWLRPVRGVAYDVTCMRHLSDFQDILAAYRAVPTYLLTYPVLQDAGIVADLRRRLERGQCQLGVQLHPWVTPPFSEAAEVRNSFTGNLQGPLEEQKLLELKRLFRACFGADPVIFRAGRYGLGMHTPALLEQHGFLIDTSLAPCSSFTDEAGPDFSASDYRTFWFGRSRRLLELPLCRSIVGWGGRPAARAYGRLAAGAPPGGIAPAYLLGLLAWTRCAERITLSPEGNDATAVGRLIGSLLRRGQNLLSLSLHSTSLSIGRNPYVRSRIELHLFYDRLSAILDMLTGRFGVRFVTASDLPRMLSPQDVRLPDAA
ncbi:MAG TPA: hypothetical protein VFN42_10185 [Acetobacteraceae bacterium]|nr:hypothetical protein [Acetobacteraceae bacterium]